MTTPITPHVPRMWHPSRKLTIGILISFLAVCVIVRLFFWDSAPLPTLDLTGIDPAVRQAIEEQLSAVRKTPNSAEAWGTLGIVLSGHVFTAQAYDCFEQAERLDPSDPRWPYHQGMIRLATAPLTAEPKIKHAAELCGTANPGPRLRLAELYLQLGHFDQAREQFQVLLRMQANHPRALLGLARLDFLAGKFEQSRAYLQIPLTHPRTLKSALTLSAEIHSRQGNAAAARLDLGRALELPKETDWPDSFVMEALRYKVGEAVLLQRIEIAFDMQRPAEGLKIAQDVTRAYPNSSLAWTSLGWAQMQIGQFPAAEKSLQVALKFDPESPRALAYLGTLRHAQKDRTGAKDYFRRVIEKKPDSYSAYHNLGQCLKEGGDRAAAIDAFRGAVKCQPFSASAHSLLGEMLLADGRADEATIHLQQAVELNPNHPNAKKLLEEANSKKTAPGKHRNPDRPN